MDIPFNKPFIIGEEIKNVEIAFANGKISGNGFFTKKCHDFFQKKYGFRKCLLTTSCTDALEMSAILLDIKPGDEVIIPSYTFVSTANAFVLRGARIVFCDSYITHPNIDHNLIGGLITKKTKAIVVVHYGGVACAMDEIMALAERNNLFVIEDAAQAIDSYYKDKPLGSLGHFGTFSFHETKNISSGEGGMLVINDGRFIERAEIIWEKGTNRAAFWRGEVDKYNWVDIGSSFLPSEIIAAFLYAQLEKIEIIQNKRKSIWNKYYEQLFPIAVGNEVLLPIIPNFATNNGHLFYLLCRNLDEQQNLLTFLKSKGVLAVFHYLSLHSSPFFKNYGHGGSHPNSDRFSECLIRLPFFYELTEEQQLYIVGLIKEFFQNE
ncbi:dTDP-4-amino-4,6-dideoxygalactose transaminase [uncultured Imperialibacter sp.]|uniref:dTDP-4-amino-4,6-dideoxygalactose transaminase n=1 Tax=uncultured Imperialibacter sp. TaxID=1672639 RepID=UPI0030D7CAB7|tara:strand:+ start:2114 stop:3247 length:1134 start_codon:yes stop_codon:yes gene_type:complete